MTTHDIMYILIGLALGLFVVPMFRGAKKSA